jgi:hypothetical protein
MELQTECICVWTVTDCDVTFTHSSEFDHPTGIVKERLVTYLNLEDGDNRLLRNARKYTEWPKSQLSGQWSVYQNIWFSDFCASLWLNVLLTVHHDINFIPVTNLMHTFLYSYNVTILYMFRAVLCSSSGGQIVCIQHMVSSLSMSGRGGRAVRRLRESR